jgi:hypothetical protein
MRCFVVPRVLGPPRQSYNSEVRDYTSLLSTHIHMVVGVAILQMTEVFVAKMSALRTESLFVITGGQVLHSPCFVWMVDVDGPKAFIFLYSYSYDE